MKRTSFQSFVLSLIIYCLILGAGYWLVSREIKNEPQKLEIVPVSLSMFSIAEPAPQEIPPKPQPIVEPVKPLPEPPKTEPKVEPEIKPKEPPKPKVKPKPVEKPKVIEKPQPVKKTEPKKAPQPEPKKYDPPAPKVEQPVIEEAVEAKPVNPSVTKMTAPTQPRFNPEQVANAEQMYLQELRSRIVQYAQDTYPKRAKRRHWEGEVKIEFKLQTNGTITGLKIIKSSGRSILDQAALEIFQEKMQFKFKPFPKEIERREWEISVPVTYHLR